jgi:hypothetical protein
MMGYSELVDYLEAQGLERWQAEEEAEALFSRPETMVLPRLRCSCPEECLCEHVEEAA